MPASRQGLVFAAVYLALFFLAFLYVEWSLTYNTANSEFCGLFEIVLTMPWSLVFIPLVNKTGYVAWYSQYSSQHLLYGFLATLANLPAALLNASILYFIGRSWKEKG